MGGSEGTKIELLRTTYSVGSTDCGHFYFNGYFTNVTFCVSYLISVVFKDMLSFLAEYLSSFCLFTIFVFRENIY